MYEQQREDQGNNLLGNVVIGAGLLGAGALGAHYLRSVAKNRARKAQVNVEDNMPRSGQSGARMMDLSALPEQTKARVYKRAAEAYPDPGVGKDVQYRNPGSGGTDLSMLVTDPNTGEIYRRGGGQSVNQVRVNQDPGVNLAKQNLGGESGRTITDNQYLASIRRSNTRLGDLTAQNAPGFAGQQGYVRNRIADSLEAPAGSTGPNVQLRNLPPANQVVQKQPAKTTPNRVDQLISEIGVDKMGRMTVGPEYAKEAAQMAATESSRQSAAVRRMEKQDPEFERIAKDILSEMRDRRGQGPAKQPRPGSGGPKLAGYSEGPVDAQDRKHIQASRRDRPETLVQVREDSAPFAADASREAIQTANDQSDLQIIKQIQSNESVEIN